MSAHNIKCFMWFLVLQVQLVIVTLGTKIGWYPENIWNYILGVLLLLLSLWKISEIKNIETSINK